MTNVYDLPQTPLTEEFTRVLHESDSVRVEQIVSAGQTSGWYDQNEAEFVALLEGRAEIVFENDKTVSLTEGDSLFIKPHERHRVSYTSEDPPCVWLCFFYSEEASRRLAAFENAYAEFLESRAAVTGELEKLKSAGKEKTVRYREALGQKMIINQIGALFSRHGVGAAGNDIC